MTIDVEISCASVPLPPDRVGKFTERVQIVRVEESHAVFERETLAGLYFGAYVI
jgi:hypothetical protein